MNMISGAALHDERVIPVRDQFPDVSDEKMSDEDGCLSRSMAVKEINTIMASEFQALDRVL